MHESTQSLVGSFSDTRPGSGSCDLPKSRVTTILRTDLSLRQVEPMTTPAVTETAQHLGLSRAGVRDLEDTGVISRAAGLDACRHGYIKHLRARSMSGSAADTQFREARAREIAVRPAERLGRYVPTEEFDAMVEQLYGLIRAELSGLPARIGGANLALRRLVEAEVHGVLHRLVDAAEKHAATHAGKAA